LSIIISTALAALRRRGSARPAPPLPRS